MKKKIIITGGLGYIGTELCRLYSGVSWHHKILVIDNRFISERVNQLRNWNIDFIQGDILDKDLINNQSLNKIVFHNSKEVKGAENIEKLNLPASFDQINKIVANNIVKRKFKTNSSLKIDNYKLDKNLRQLIKGTVNLELTEKEIELIELLKNKSFIKKKEILSTIWKYSSDADTHTVETHIYRLRKKIKDIFKDEKFIKSSKKGYTI